MTFMALMIALAIAAFIFVAIAALMLFRKGWFISWLKGSTGIILFVLAGFLALSAFDVSSYKALVQEETLATVSFQRLANQRYKANVSIADAVGNEYELAGDLWQIDAKIINWAGPIQALGLLPGYRFDRISGRYISIEQENQDTRTAYELHQSLGFDLWNWANSATWFPWIDTTYGSATFLPMKDGALFSIRLTSRGLIARPMNEPAQEAIRQWQ